MAALAMAATANARPSLQTTAEDDWVCYSLAVTAADSKNGFSAQDRLKASISATYFLGRLDGRGADIGQLAKETIPKLKTMDLAARSKTCGELLQQRAGEMRPKGQ